MIKLNKLVIFLIYFLILPTSSFARWASYDDYALEKELSQIHTKVNADGSSESLIDMKIKILKESGRSSMANYHLYYNGDVQELEIIEAKTINGDEITHVAKNKIEDSPLASQGAGFDQTRQVLLSYPNLKVGSTACVRYRLKSNIAPVKGFFSSNFIFGRESYSQKTIIKLESQIPLYIKVNDPLQALEVSDRKEDGLHIIDITNTKPVGGYVIDEPAGSVVDIRKLVWVSLSSINDIKDVGRQMSAGYEKVLASDLPKKFVEIARAAKEESSSASSELKERALIDGVTSRLAEHIQYMGDWRSVKGRFFPRPLSEISNSKLGDCKDFSAATISIMRSFGFDAYPVFVRRGVHNLSNTHMMPSLYDFNHAMVYLVSPAGNNYWIDPTNNASMAGYIFPDIAGKMAFVTGKDKISYEQIPHVNPEDNLVVTNYKIQVTPQKTEIHYKGDLSFYKQGAQPLTGIELFWSDKQIRNRFLEIFNDSPVQEQHIEHFGISDLKSRIVKDVKMTYSYKDPNAMFNSNLGKGISMPGNNTYIRGIVNSIKLDQVGDMVLEPSTKIVKCTISGARAQMAENLSYEVDTPWVRISRKLISKNCGDIEMVQKVIVKKSIITNDEINSEEYKDFRDGLLNSFSSPKIIFQDNPDNQKDSIDGVYGECCGCE